MGGLHDFGVEVEFEVMLGQTLKYCVKFGNFV